MRRRSEKFISRMMERMIHTIPNQVFANNYAASHYNFWGHFRMYQEDFDLVVLLCLSSGEFSIRRINQKGTIKLMEIIAACMYFLMHGVSYGTLKLIFGVSSGHLNRNMSKVLNAIIRGVGRKGCEGYIGFPDDLASASDRWSAGRYPGDTSYATFEGCIGSADGTLIPMSLRKDFLAARWRCRKGFTATNVLGIVNWDKTFAAIWPGGEGSAHDSTIATEYAKAHLDIPDGYFVLFDAGISLTEGVWLTPYRNTRYHLREFGAGTGRPQTYQELFNLRHSVRRSGTIEIAWGLLKGRFKILRHGICAKYISRVVEVVLACATLHNFIQRRHGVSDSLADVAQNHSSHRQIMVGLGLHHISDDSFDGPLEPVDPLHAATHAHPADMQPLPTESLGSSHAVWRDTIARAMWDDYCAYFEASQSAQPRWEDDADFTDESLSLAASMIRCHPNPECWEAIPSRRRRRARSR